MFINARLHVQDLRHLVHNIANRVLINRTRHEVVLQVHDKFEPFKLVAKVDIFLQNPESFPHILLNVNSLDYKEAFLIWPGRYDESDVEE